MASTQTNNVSAGNTDLTDSKTARSVMFQPTFNEPALQSSHFSCIAASPMWASRASSHHIPLFSALFSCKDALCTIFFAKMTSDKKVNLFYSIPKKFWLLQMVPNCKILSYVSNKSSVNLLCFTSAAQFFLQLMSICWSMLSSVFGLLQHIWVVICYKRQQKNS